MEDINIEKAKTWLKHEPRGGGVETSMVGPMGISVDSARRKIVQGLKNKGYFLLDPSWVLLLPIILAW